MATRVKFELHRYKCIFVFFVKRIIYVLNIVYITRVTDTRIYFERQVSIKKKGMGTTKIKRRSHKNKIKYQNNKKSNKKNKNYQRSLKKEVVQEKKEKERREVYPNSTNSANSTFQLQYII